MQTTFESIEEVVESNLCIGCGACASINGSTTKMQENEYGLYQPKAEKARSIGIKNIESSVCPFNSPINETEISAQLFPGTRKYAHIGRYLSTYAGFVKDKEERGSSSSGGLGSWILEELLTRGLIDGVAHVGNSDEGTLFKYKISRSASEIKAGKKSKYYSTEISEVISKIKSTPGRYAITGVPCFIKAIQLLRNSDPILKQRIVFTIGLVCGHMKTHAYSDWLAWEAGVPPGSKYSIDYRHKNPDQPANNYSTLISSQTGTKAIKNSDIPLNKWGYGLFKPNACEYCDDVFAETADVCIGDAWLPQYVNNPLGTNIVIVRNSLLLNIFNDEISSASKAHIEELSPELIVDSQLGGIRHRTEGLAHRLTYKETPSKLVRRTQLKRAGNAWLEKMYDLRFNITQKSHILFQEAKAINSLDAFRNPIKVLVVEYESVYREARKSLRDKIAEAIEYRVPFIYRAIKGTLQTIRAMRNQPK
ncbi:hypothetical protein CBP36_17455 [Acidovorax carolinensis]|uniref:4Fe-4S ferredoxin-type domain-containing protein n=1 Tax=Acidovorax carolinensis TaxID=553814 RepID=A0A240UFT7_9BURK|nr:Coenzyme F420 hydrogenase/dehydrogenase, beta subunit C-terminal domain [Acidovorax carolinensis]ART54020.1 hypothetical protein CBP35_01460 [Acidovorax carolinensis]ART60364.1 hypothetical protein CBP36_17455 [Acidovorax carolinensis]